MPEEEYAWLPRGDILTFEEVTRLIDVFADLGVDKVRLTGGEPLLRRDLSRLVKMIASEPRIRDARPGDAPRETRLQPVSKTTQPHRFLLHFGRRDRCGATNSDAERRR